VDEIGTARDEADATQEFLLGSFRTPSVEPVEAVPENAGEKQAVEKLAVMRAGSGFYQIGQRSKAVSSHATGGCVRHAVIVGRRK
jgi:hypothetical protein